MSQLVLDLIHFFLNFRMDKLAKAGLFDYWKRRDLPVRDPCSADSDFRERQLRNGDLQSTYILCGSGYLLAFISFLFECISRLVFNRKSKFTYFNFSFLVKNET
jgi:hypothetical protein